MSVTDGDNHVITEFSRAVAERHGSLMKAWRCVFDPMADGALVYSEFIQALVRLGWHGNTSALWAALMRRAAENGSDLVGLRELSPKDSFAIDTLKACLDEAYGGAIIMFRTLTDNKLGESLSHAKFSAICAKLGAVDHDRIFREMLDLEGVGNISERDIAVLETNGLKRKITLEPSLLIGLDAAKKSTLEQAHRRRNHRRVHQNAFKEFRKKLRFTSGGSVVRGIKQHLDAHGNLTMSKIDFLKGCRKIAFEGDLVSLWRLLDADSDGTVHLQDLDLTSALALAGFKTWCAAVGGTCVETIVRLGTMTRRKSPRWTADDLSAALHMCGWRSIPGVSDKQAMAIVHEACDDARLGVITAQDAAFLDRWEPMPWLYAEADAQGASRLKKSLQHRYKDVIVGWRRLLDRDDTNRVSYKALDNACQILGITNVPGVWRALDSENSGYISLMDLDSESARALLDFRKWAEQTFGTLQRAFQAIDLAGSNAVPFPVFARALSNFGFAGDARLLFHSLKPDGRGSSGTRDVQLAVEDLTHLNTWEQPDSDDDLGSHVAEVPRLDVRRGNLLVCPPSRGTRLSSRSSTSSARRSCAESQATNATSSDLLSFCRGRKEHELYCSTSSAALRPANGFSMGDMMQRGVRQDTVESDAAFWDRRTVGQSFAGRIRRSSRETHHTKHQRAFRNSLQRCGDLLGHGQGSSHTGAFTSSLSLPRLTC